MVFHRPETNQPSQPTTFVIFGITGDLARNKLITALFDLFNQGLLGDNFSIVGFARRPYTHQGIQTFLRDYLPEHDQLANFLEHITYHQGDFHDGACYHALEQELRTIDANCGQCTNKLYYLAVPPAHYRTILDHVASTNLGHLCDDISGWTRILIEKPFGRDLASAEALDKHLGSLFAEEQIFRIDHYLAKETVQNLMAFRFANGLFQPLWNNKYITDITIRAFESKDIGTRGGFYDNVGALRDVGQNHLLQLLATITMDACNASDTEAVRQARTEILGQLTLDTDRLDMLTRGQYSHYQDTHQVDDSSETETFFRVPARLTDPNWANIPITLESGKALKGDEVSIIITFRAPEACMVFPNHGQPLNQLTFRIQPDEGITLSLWTKEPGLGYNLQEQELNFSYFTNHTALMDAYERVLYDAICGDQLLFTRTDEVLAAWKFVESVQSAWSDKPLITYSPNANPESIHE